jgi:hypothetical protein
VLFAPTKWPLGSIAIVLAASVGAAAVVVSTIMWWIFERNTDQIRRTIEHWAQSIRYSHQQK